jgi:hypothetical protein
MSCDEVKDWKECLTAEDQRILAEIFETTKKHKCSYMCADDVKIAQLWCDLLEMKKENDKLKETVEKVQLPFKAIAEIGEAEKRKTIERLLVEILKPEPEHEEATQKLVNSLMKF